MSDSDLFCCSQWIWYHWFKKRNPKGICFSSFRGNAPKWSCWTFVDTKSSKCNPSQDLKRTNITPLIPTVLQGTASEQGWSKEPILLPSSPQCCRVQHQSRVELKRTNIIPFIPISLPSSPQCCRVQHQSRVDLKSQCYFLHTHNATG